MAKSNNLFLSLVFVVEVCAAILSFVLQWRINQFDKSISFNKAEIAKTDVEIKVLKTEISHLTSIIRVKDMAGKYLPNFKNITSDDFVKIIDIPINPQFE